MSPKEDIAQGRPCCAAVNQDTGGTSHRRGSLLQMSIIASVRSTLTHLGVLAAHPAAFVIVGLYVAIWYVVEQETLDLHGIATIATWVMTLFIQRAAHRDTQAIHAKLDELLYAHQGARNDVSNIDQLEPEEVEAQRGASGPETERGTF